MQYENISTDLLLASDWPKVTFVVTEPPATNYNTIHEELNCYESRGRYSYMYETTLNDDSSVEDFMHIWFESEQDETYFALKFAS